MDRVPWRAAAVSVETEIDQLLDERKRRDHANLWGLFRLGYVLGSRDEDELVAKLVWRVKLVTELQAGETTEVEIARLERDEQAGLADLGLRLAEAKQLMAAIQAEIVPAQVTVAGEHRRTCMACAGDLASKGHYTATFRSLFGDVPIRIWRLLTCPCQDMAEARSFAAFDLEAADRGARTGLCNGAVCGAGAVWQGRGPAVGIASDQRGTERGHGAKQDDAGRRGGCAAARRENGRAGTAGQTRRCWA